MTRTTSSTTTVYSDDHEYDARGKRFKTSSLSDLSDITSDYWESIYDGYGALFGSGRKRNGNPTVDINYLDALGNMLSRNSDSTLGNPKRVTFSVVGDKISSIIRPPYRIDQEIPDSTRFQTEYVFDANGNQEREENKVWKVQVNPPTGQIPNFNVIPLGGHSFSFSTYGIDNKLRVAQKTWYEANGAKRTLLTEYRYDALGRRVLARTQRDTSCVVGQNSNTEWDCLSTMDRYVWDGDQLLAEFRGAGANNYSEASLNLDGNGAGAFYGLVRYTHAGGIDEPLAVWGGSSGVYGVVPHFSWRSNVEAGSNIQTGALLENGSPPWIWPNRYKDINFAPEIRYTIPEPTRWLGSLVEGQIDLNGLAYRRNRYYNPSSGRFTSEDPIGLAGGLNLYGFAEGDPVNFSDPFGLCKNAKGEPVHPSECDQPLVDQSANAFAFASGAFGLVRGLVSAGMRALAGALVEKEAAAFVTNYATKAAAKEALAGMELPAAQAAAARSAISRATAKESVELIRQPSGNLMVHLTRPGRNGFQVMQSTISPNGAKSVTQYGVDVAGRVVIDPKIRP